MQRSSVVRRYLKLALNRVRSHLHRCCQGEPSMSMHEPPRPREAQPHRSSHRVVTRVKPFFRPFRAPFGLPRRMPAPFIGGLTISKIRSRLHLSRLLWTLRKRKAFFRNTISTRSQHSSRPPTPCRRVSHRSQDTAATLTMRNRRQCSRLHPPLLLRASLRCFLHQSRLRSPLSFPRPPVQPATRDPAEARCPCRRPPLLRRQRSARSSRLARSLRSTTAMTMANRTLLPRVPRSLDLEWPRRAQLRPSIRCLACCQLPSAGTTRCSQRGRRRRNRGRRISLRKSPRQRPSLRCRFRCKRTLFEVRRQER